MKNYEKPIVLANSELSEGVYAASGTTDDRPKCDSIYMKGVWQEPDYSQWATGEQRSYRKQFGCLGCPAYRYNGCGLQSDYIDANYSPSYDADNGNRKPSWEKKGYGPNDPATDWGM